MKYCEIIGLYEYFEPFYDITHEHKTYWKRFIPNDKFYDILRITLDSIESTTPQNKKSIWIQGTYGTGKSHASAVIKHLLWDDYQEIEEFLGRFPNIQLREKVKNFRKNKRVFPVVLKGVSNITDNRTFSLVIERSVKSALKANNIELQTKSDFEKMLVQIKDNPLNIDWEGIIKDNQELKMYVNKKSDLIKKLEGQDIKILSVLESIISKKGVHFSYAEVDKWLNEVSEEIKNKNIATSLIILWDEFTSVLELDNKGGLINQLQGISELSKDSDVFLYVISHRKPYQAGLTDEDVKKVFDRFHLKDYSMEPITTFHIISSSILKKDNEKWSELKNKFLNSQQSVNNLIERLSGNDSTAVKDEIRNLFPIHPYTAYLATFIARNIGSTERSIFNFLNDKNKGFLKFLDTEIGDSSLLTADYLWDFFIDEFERDNSGKFASVLEKYNLHIKKLEALGRHHTSIFKGVLLLNALYRMISTAEATQSLVVPSKDNIKSIFMGDPYTVYVDEVLDFIDKNEIVRKTPDELYLVSFSSLPIMEVEREKQRLQQEYEDVAKILGFNGESRNQLIQLITNGVLRKTEITFYSASEREHILRNKILKDFNLPYSLHFAVFLSKEETDRYSAKTLIENISKEDDFNSVIFLIIDEPFGKDRYVRFINYVAESSVAHTHNFQEESISNQNFAKKIVEDWINNIKSSYASMIINGKENRHIMNRFGSSINEGVSPGIFRYGLENLQEVRKNQNVWTFKQAQKSAEIFLFASSRTDITVKTARGPEAYLRGILKNDKGHYVIEEDLEIKQHSDREHPLVKITEEAETKIGNFQNHPNFNLGEKLKFLTEPPYGIYTNMVNMALIGFVLRKYIGKLYEAGTGRLIEKDKMRDKIVDLFRYWQEGKYSDRLDVRFGTIEEKDLVENLKEIFSIDEIIGLNDIRWKIREFVKGVQFPIWSIKYLPEYGGVKSAVDEIFILTKSIDREIGYDDIKRVLDAGKNNKVDLQLSLKQEKIQQGFIFFIKQVEYANILDSETEDVIQYLNQSMQEEVASWEEEKVKSKVKDWRMTLKPPIQPPGPITPPIPGPPVVPPPDYTERVKTKLRQYPGDVKELLLRILEEHPEVSTIISKYLD